MPLLFQFRMTRPSIRLPLLPGPSVIPSAEPQKERTSSTVGAPELQAEIVTVSVDGWKTATPGVMT